MLLVFFGQTQNIFDFCDTMIDLDFKPKSEFLFLRKLSSQMQTIVVVNH